MSKKLTLDEVLDEFSAAADRPSEALVREWTKKYPDFDREIVDFAVEWTATELSMADVDLDAEQEDRLVARTMSHIQQVAYQLQSESMTSPVSDAQIERVEAAFRARIKQPSLTASLGIDDTIMALIEEHMILPPFPRRLLDAFCLALNVSLQAFNTWLFQDNRPSMASYAARTPSFKRWTFQQAVENSTLSDEAKRQWLRELT